MQPRLVIDLPLLICRRCRVQNNGGIDRPHMHRQHDTPGNPDATFTFSMSQILFSLLQCVCYCHTRRSIRLNHSPLVSTGSLFAVKCPDSLSLARRLCKAFHRICLECLLLRKTGTVLFSFGNIFSHKPWRAMAVTTAFGKKQTP